MSEHPIGKKALITGITGQDGSYLAEFLIGKGYEVHGIVRRSSTFNRGRIEHLEPDIHRAARVHLHYGDLTDSSNLARLIEKISPDEIYNLGAQSHVRVSFDIPEYTIDSITLGTLRLLEAIRDTRIKTKVYQASSSEMFGNTPPPQNEETPFHPVSPYGIAKLAAFHLARGYRSSYGLFVSNGILFNHESPRRGEGFVTKKITIGVAEILAGKRDKIYLGNLDAKRDWGYAPEYVEVMWKMLQQPEPDDYVIATGEIHSVREFLEECFRLAGIKEWTPYVSIDPLYYRPSEVHELMGDTTKAKQKLGWNPTIKFVDLARIMLQADCEKLGVRLDNFSPNGEK